MSLPDSREDLGLNLWGDLVSHDGLELWLLQADIWEERTLIGWVQLPHHPVLGTQGEKVPVPDRVGGLWCCVCHGILYLVAMASQIICISHEDDGQLPLGAD